MFFNPIKVMGKLERINEKRNPLNLLQRELCVIRLI
jgi:hypothetical protein